MPKINKSFKRAGFRAVTSIGLIVSALFLFSCKGAGEDGGTSTPAKAAGLYIGAASTPVADTDTLTKALDKLASAATDNGIYTIVMNKSSSLAARPLHYSDNQVQITLEGSGGTRTVQLTGTGSLFTVGNKVTLILGSGVTLKGVPSNTAALVTVSDGGKLEVGSGAVITENKSNGAGGGIFVSQGGAATITGGTLSKNQAATGGGIRVNQQATLIMSSGKIEQNLAVSDTGGAGGGILLRGTVTLNGGSITGNTASGTDAWGGGVGLLGGELVINGAAITGNKADGSYAGGGVAIAVGSVTFKNGEIAGNTTTAGGAAASGYNLRRWDTTSYFINETSKTCNATTGFLLE